MLCSFPNSQIMWVTKKERKKLSALFPPTKRFTHYHNHQPIVLIVVSFPKCNCGSTFRLESQKAATYPFTIFRCRSWSIYGLESPRSISRTFSPVQTRCLLSASINEGRSPITIPWIYLSLHREKPSSGILNVQHFRQSSINPIINGPLHFCQFGLWPIFQN